MAHPDDEQATSEARCPDGRRLRRSLKLRSMVAVICVAISITAVFYSLVAMAGYLAFPTSVQSNILLNFDDSDNLMLVRVFAAAAPAAAV